MSMDSIVHKQSHPSLVESKDSGIAAHAEFHFHKYLNRVKAILEGTDSKFKPTKVM